MNISPGVMRRCRAAGGPLGYATVVSVHPRQHVDLLVLVVQEVLEITDFGLKRPYTLLQRLCVAPGEGSPTQLIARPTLEPDIGTLRARRPYAITPNFLFSG